MGLLSHVLTYLSGVVSMPLLERLFGSAFAELRQHWQSVAAGRHLVGQQLDPLLKAADELHGKLRSLAEEDFREFKDIPNADLSDPQLVDLCSTLYLFAQFWARLEIFRRESFHAEVSATKQGALLLRFLRSLESRRVRLVDRAWQRAIGELLTAESGARKDTINFSDFVERYEAGERMQRWLRPLEETLRDTARGKTRDRQRSRQRVLQYGVVVHAFVDTLDPEHRTTRARPAYPNKLTRRAKREIVGRVFDTYLPEVTKDNIRKYTGIIR
jgi:hypothetical protein